MLFRSDVLEYGFTYGSSGTALHGKKFLLSFTAGSGAEVYHEKMAHDLPDFMPAFQETATLTGMEWQEPVYSYGALTDADLATKHNDRLIARLVEISA